MSREILFKAKRKDNGEWVEGYFFNDGMETPEHYFVGSLVIEEYTGRACDEWDITGIDFAEVDPSTLCQYTGKRDKNGMRIFENDIIKYHSSYDADCYAQIKFGGYRNPLDSLSTLHVGFYVDWRESSLREDLGYWTSGNDVEVVGSAFDAHEL